MIIEIVTIMGEVKAPNENILRALTILVPILTNNLPDVTLTSTIANMDSLTELVSNVKGARIHLKMLKILQKVDKKFCENPRK